MATTTLPDSTPPQEPAEPNYREVRRFCIVHHNPLRPSDLQREFRVPYSRAARLLEELEADHVLVRRPDGSFTAWPERPRDSNGRPLRDRSLANDRHAGEQCEICGWCIPLPLRKKPRASGCHDHHVVPVACGGSDAPVNRLLLCPNHHQLAHSLFPVSGGVYRGPTSRDDLADALRLADADRDAFTLARARLAIDTLTSQRPLPPPPQAEPAPPHPQPAPRPTPRRLLPNPTLALLRLHVHHNHRGPIFDCRTCADTLDNP